MDQSAIEKILVTEGFAKVHATKKLTEFRRGGESLYLKTRGADHPLVVHGRHGVRLSSLASISGVRRTKAVSQPYHNSNMRSFDLRQNTGKMPTRYGFDFGFDTPTALNQFLRSL